MPRWRGQFYTYAVRVFTRATNRIETNIVTDPYSVSLGGEQPAQPAREPGRPRADAARMAGFDRSRRSRRPKTSPSTSCTSATSAPATRTVRQAWRGTYLAFTEAAIARACGTWRRWRAAGLTHVHLLPSFDIATHRRGQIDVAGARRPVGLPADSDQQQAAVAAVRDPRRASTGATTRGTTTCRRAATPRVQTARRASASSARWCRPSTARACAW